MYVRGVVCQRGGVHVGVCVCGGCVCEGVCK